MKIGIPKEVKPLEGRVALSPNACRTLIQAGHDVSIETSAGVLAGFLDHDYQQAGVLVQPSAQSLYASSSLIVKVKEPIEQDLQYLRSDHKLFCFLHLAANPELEKHLQSIGLTAIAFESIEEHGKRPVLAPMSGIAGRLAVLAASQNLQSIHHGQGLLFGGLGNLVSTSPGNVLILGAGIAGTHAATLASAMGAHVRVYDQSKTALQRIQQQLPDIEIIEKTSVCLDWVKACDVLIGALLVPNQKAPKLITRAHVKTMKKGAVIVDISIDQGGCVETSHPTTYLEPTFTEEDVVHFCVTNMPGAVPKTATEALSEILPPYILGLSQSNGEVDDKILQNAINVKAGKTLINI